MQAMADTLGAIHSCVFHGSVGWLGFQMMIASSWCKDFLASHFGLCIHDPFETTSVSFAAKRCFFLYSCCRDRSRQEIEKKVNEKRCTSR